MCYLCEGDGLLWAIVSAGLLAIMSSSFTCSFVIAIMIVVSEQNNKQTNKQILVWHWLMVNDIDAGDRVYSFNEYCCYLIVRNADAYCLKPKQCFFST